MSNDNPYYSELDGGYTVYQGPPDLNRAVRNRPGTELQNPGRGKEFSSFSPPPPAIQPSPYSMNPNEKSQRYGLDPGREDYTASFGDGDKPMPGANSGNPEKGIVHLLSVYADKCSLNGIIFIKSSKYIAVKIIWTILLLVALVVMVLHLYELISKFYEYEKQSQIELKFESLPFPAVTFCNVNAMKYSKVGLATQQLQSLVDSVDPDQLYKDVDEWEPEYEEEHDCYDDNGDYVYDDETCGEDDDEATRRKRDTNTKVTVKSRTDNFFDDFNFTDYDDTFVDDFGGREAFDGSWESESEPAAFDKLNQQFINLYNQETANVRHQMGHKIQDMLVQCSFGGRKCVQQNFTRVASSSMGNCYTIQYNKFVSRQSGPAKGLSLMLYLEGDEYVPGITNAKGIKVVVHEPDTIPFPDTEGTAIGAGMETNMGLRWVSIKRLGQPHGECTKASTFKTKYGIKYSRQACQAICEMERMIEACSCYDATKPSIVNLIKNIDSNVKSCQKNKDNVFCMEDMKHAFDDNVEACHCDSPCSEVVYRKTISSKPWPNNAFAKLIAKTVCKEKGETNPICSYADFGPVELRENFVKLNIYFETLNFENISEQEDYTLFQFVSDIGGTVGLYVGLSVLSMFEVFHLLIAIVRYVCCGNWQKKDK